MRKIALATRDTQNANAIGPTPEESSDAAMQRGQGYGRLVVHGGKNGNRIVDLMQRSPVRIMFPTIEGRSCSEAVLINSGGGVTGGDKIDYHIVAMNGSNIAVTTQAAEKLYKAISLPAVISTRLEILEGAQLAWLPQETIVFDRSQFRRKTELDIAPSAEVLVAELLVLGRAAHGEKLAEVSIHDEWRVRKNGRLIWADAFRLTTPIAGHMNRRSLLGDCAALCTLLYSGTLVEVMQSLIRKAAPSDGSWVGSTIVNGLLVIRIAARDAASLRQAVVVVLELFSATKGQGCFQVPKMWSC